MNFKVINIIDLIASNTNGSWYYEGGLVICFVILRLCRL